MAGGVAIRVEDKEVTDRIHALGQAMDDPTPALEDFAAGKLRRVVLSFQRGSGESGSGEAPHQRSGQLAKSITYRVDHDGVVIGTNKRYAEQQQKGGTINAKGKLLTLPVHDRARGKRARDFANLDFVPSQNDDPDTIGVLARITHKGKKNETITAYFVLARHVTTKPHPFLFWDDRDPDALDNCLAKHLKLK